MEAAILNNKITITSRGITFQAGLTVEEWRQTLSMLKAVHDGYHMALADTIAYGRANYGEETVAEAMVQLEFPMADFNSAQDIARIPLGLRETSEGLTAEHYHVVGNQFADDEIQQKNWIALAHKNKLSPRELRRSIEVGHVVKDDPSKSGRESGGLVTIQSIMFSFSRWSDQVGGEKEVLKWPEAQRREWLKQTEGFAALRETVEKSLPAVLGAEY